MKILLIVFSIIAIASVIILSVFFYGITQNPDFEEVIKVWANFGDFMGGTLNPILAALSLFGLLFTIYYQNKELEETRQELKESRIAQQEQSKSLALQNKATQLQIFENTFFKLLELFLEIRESVSIEFKATSKGLNNNSLEIYINGKYMQVLTFRIEKEELLKSSIAISKYLLILKNILHHYTDNNYDTFNNYFEFNTRAYFSQIYQILKFIKDKEKENNLSAKRYSNIVRAQFSVDELELLFFHCLGSIGREKFKELVEIYEFFEHLKLNEDIEKQLLEYDIKAFGKNEEILKKYKELEKSKA